MENNFVNKKLNDLEKALLNEIANANSDLKENLRKHYSVLKVKSRVYTGVGVYINFEYSDLNLPLINKNHITGKSELIIPNLESSVTYEIAITDGLISFMELVANGSEWNGNHSGFKLSV